MLADLTAAELEEWIQFYRIDPFGEQRADLRIAILCSLVSGVMGNGQPPRNFMPFRDDLRRLEPAPGLEDRLKKLFGPLVTNHAEHRVTECKADS